MSRKTNKTKGLSLSYKLILIMLAISLIPLAISAYLNISGSGQALEEANFHELEAIKTIKTNQIENFFDEREGDIRVLSNTPIVKESLKSFDQAYRAQGIDGSRYNIFLERYNSYFSTYVGEYGYYDIFLINTEGDIVYTEAKESDLGQSLSSGQLSDSNLAQAYAKGLNEVSLVDYQHYAPSDAPAMFASAPVKENANDVAVTINSLGDLSNQIGEIVELISEIASVSQEAASNSEEVAAASEEQSASTEEIVSAAEDLANMADDLTKAVNKFNL